MSIHNQPPKQAVATLPIMRTVLSAFPIAYGDPGLLLRAAAGGLLLIAIAAIIFLAVPNGLTLMLFLFVPLAAYSHFGVNWYRIVLLGPAGLVRPMLRWDARHWRVFAYAAGINAATLIVQFPLTIALPSLASLIALLVFYVTARLSFVFPALAVEERYTLAHSWRHTQGQGVRLTIALLLAGLPLYLGVTIIVGELFVALIGVPIAAVAALGPENAESVGEILAQVSPFAVIAVMFAFHALVMVVLAVMFTIVAMAFRTCTGWVPAAPAAVVPASGSGDGNDDSNGSGSA